jgi:hypothetical protein
LRVTTEYRSLDEHEQVGKIYNKTGISKKVVAKACNLKKRVVERIKIIKESRGIKLIEKSRLLALEYEIELVR